MNFLPISIFAYALSGGAVLIDKILLKKSLPNPIAYTFYLTLLGMLTVVLIPFFEMNLTQKGLLIAVCAGITGVISFLAFFQSLKTTEASVVGPVVGALNPFFSLIIGAVIFNQLLTVNQHIAFFVILAGGLIITWNNISSAKLNSIKPIFWMGLSGFAFAISYVLLKEAFLASNFITGLIISRLSAGGFVLLFLVFPQTRKKIFEKKAAGSYSNTKIFLLVFLGQSMGAVAGLLLIFAISLNNPALVNSFFGIQYLVILAASLLLYKKHPHLLNERLSKSVIVQKIIGAFVMSIGLYLLAR